MPYGKNNRAVLCKRYADSKDSDAVTACIWIVLELDLIRPILENPYKNGHTKRRPLIWPPSFNLSCRTCTHIRPLAAAGPASNQGSVP